MDKKLNKIKVIIPFYNPGNFLDSCIGSVLTQDYENYEVLFIDDCSTDGSFDKIPACTFKTNADGTPVMDAEGQPIIESKDAILEITKCKNLVAWKSSQRNTALANIHNGIMNFCTDPDDIVVILDGDDSLIGNKALSYINDFYNEHGCWIMYGSSKWTDGRPCCAKPYNKEEWDNLRNIQFKVSHIRSFRAGVYQEIGKQDPTFSCMKDQTGEFYRMTYDVAMFFPMLEIAGFDKVKYNPTALYRYNRHNPISDDKVDQNLQWSIHAEISKKSKFKQVESYSLITELSK
jgi:glycosyltransferase involved in cell wall biosynthesis